jgi:hypothetical protein
LQQPASPECVQPVAGLQESPVHTLLSLQSVGPPGPQLPPLQVSPVVQALPSEHGAVLLTYSQPVCGLQLSSVQTLPSLQFGAGPPTQAPPLQASAVVQAFPSLHGSLLFTCVQPLAGLQPSSVHPLLSLQLSAVPPTQPPALQVSLVVQALPSSHAAVLLTCPQPVNELQLSSVQPLPSSQFGAAPPTQLPPLQMSLVVQALPSSHGLLLFTCSQPLAALQLSLVHALLSLQSGGAPPTQAPALQVSLVVQALPSLHGSLLFTCVQPLAGLQPSSVHPLLSLQSAAGPPTQVPPLQVSVVVQALPSSHDAALLVCVQPVCESQLSSVHTLLSLQLGGGPPTHAPPLQVSSVVQALLSSHELLLFACVQPVLGLQPSSVQTLVSLQSTGLLTHA